MPTLFRDIETRSTVDLPAVGAAVYAEHPTTAVWCVSYAVDDGAVELWHPGESIPECFIEAARDPAWLIVAHNDSFERAIEEKILAPQFGWPLMPIERHRCTMAMSLACSLPGKLEKVAEALGLELRKDATGHKLMLAMAKPRKAKKGEDPAGIYWRDAPEDIARLGEYCRQDVEVERALYHRLPPLSDAEQTLWQLDATINQRGFYTDGALLEAGAHLAASIHQAMQSELAELTAGAVTSTDQVAKLQRWLTERGAAVKDMQKATLSAALRRKELDPAARRALELRRDASHDVKADSMIAHRSADGRIRGTLKFHGAGTGRWSAFGVQVQNYVRDPGDIDDKIAAILAGDAVDLATIADAARGAIVAAPGHRFLIGDFSGVESRVLAWIAGETTKLEQWRKFDATGDLKGDPYFIMGKACGLPAELARDRGKTIDLAFGFMGGIQAYASKAAEDDTSSDADREGFKQTFRDRHPRTVGFWGALDRATIKAVRTPGTAHAVKGVSFACAGDFLELTLPSGRIVRYPFPRIGQGKFGDPCVIFKDTALGKWADCNHGRGAYGGLWTENVVQAIARDLLAAAMIRLEAAGYPIVLTVHDEVIAEVPDGFGSLDEFKRLLIAATAWAADLPIAAKVREGQRYSKPAKAAPPLPDDPELDVEPATVAAEVPPAAAPGAPVQDRPAAEAAHAGPSGGDRASEPPPLTFDQAWAAFKKPRQPDEVPKTNGKGNGADPHAGHAGDYDSDGPHGQGHGERDTGRQVAFYVYQHADGANYLGVKRTTTKQFPQFHWTGSAWTKGAPPGPKIPYRLPELVKAPLDAWILICAGEKDADSAAALGFMATTNSEGERKGAWAPELNAWFAGRHRVAIMEDNDKTGIAHAIEVANALRGIVPDIRIIAFRELPEHGDLTDWIEGHDAAALRARIEAAKPARPKLHIAPIREWDGMPAPEIGYGVPDRFPLEVVNLFSGEGGGGKSTLTQQLAAAHALGGREWLGCTPRQGPAIYVECEDPENALHWRQKAIAEHYGVTQATLADAGFTMLPMADGEESAILATAPDKSGIIHPTPLYDQLYEMAGDIKPVMIGIASAAIVFAGNENVRPEVQQFMWLLRRLARVSGGYVLLVAQPSLTGIGDASVSHAGLSGTTQWHNGSRGRAVLRSVKPEGGGADTGLREIRFYKNQYGALSASCFVRYANGLFLPVAGMSMDGAERAARAEEVFIALLRKFRAQKQAVSHRPGCNYAPARFAEHPEADGISKREFTLAMQRLLDAKAIEIKSWGRPSHPAYYLAVSSDS